MAPLTNTIGYGPLMMMIMAIFQMGWPYDSLDSLLFHKYTINLTGLKMTDYDILVLKMCVIHNFPIYEILAKQTFSIILL